MAGGPADAGGGCGSGGNSFETAVVGQLVEHGRRKAELLGFRCDRRGGRNGDTSAGCQNANGACRLRYLDNGEKYNVMHRDLTFIAGSSGGGVASPAASLAGQRVDSSNISIGLRVKRGPDWHYGDQDGGGGSGEVLGWVTLDGSKSGESPGSNGWAKVKWDSGRKDSYEIGADGDYCLSVAGPGSADSSDP